VTLRDALYACDTDTIVTYFDENAAVKLPGELLATDGDTTAFKQAFFDAVDNVYDYQGTLVIDGRKDGTAAQAKLKLCDERIVAYYQETPRNKNRFRLDLSFCGTLYEGFQRQPKKRTIQGELESALAGLIGKPLDIHPASRTDAGVHAIHHVAHVDIDTPLSPEDIKRLLNRMLPDDIRVIACTRVPGVFHARYDATGKTYRYRILHVDDPFRAHLTMRADKIDFDMLKPILLRYVGIHDFQNFAKSTDKDTVRTIHRIDVRQDNDETIIDIQGEGFLRHMVRMMIARALDDYHKSKDTITATLRNPGKPIPKPLVPASGLHLVSVHYEPIHTT